MLNLRWTSMLAGLLALMVVVHANAPAGPTKSTGNTQVKFPPAEASGSPDGKWNLLCTSLGDHDTRHLLLVGSDGRRRELRAFERQCDAVWSVDGSHLAVTDWLSSSDSDVFVYTPEDPAVELSLRSLLPKEALKKEELDGHCYFEATKWLGPRRLEIRISGHTDGPSRSFLYRYGFDVRSRKFKQLKPPANPGAP